MVQMVMIREHIVIIHVLNNTCQYMHDKIKLHQGKISTNMYKQVNFALQIQLWQDVAK